MSGEERKLVELFSAKECADEAYEKCDWNQYKRMLKVQLELLEVSDERIS